MATWRQHLTPVLGDKSVFDYPPINPAASSGAGGGTSGVPGSGVSAAAALPLDFKPESAAITEFGEGYSIMPTSTSANYGPNTGEAGLLIIERIGSNGIQTFTQFDDQAKYDRVYTGGAWTAWQPVGAGSSSTAYNERGPYSSGATYFIDDVVNYQGSTWIALVDSLTGVTPVEGVNWTLLAEKGEQGVPGADGTDGADGADGADGNTILYGTTAPASGLGVDGNFYLNTASLDWYGPKTAGAWGSPTSLIAPAFAPSHLMTTSGTIPTNRHFIKVDCSVDDVVATLPTAVGRDGAQYIVKKIDSTANLLTIDTTGSETVEGLDSIDTAVRGDAVWVASDGANWWIVSPPTFIAA